MTNRATSLRYGLHCAAWEGDVENVRRFLAEGASVRVRVHDAYPLQWAATNGSRAKVRAVLEAGGPLGGRDVDGHNAFHWASWDGHGPVVIELMAQMRRDQRKALLRSVDGHLRRLEAMASDRNLRHELCVDVSLDPHAEDAIRFPIRVKGPYAAELAGMLAGSAAEEDGDVAIRVASSSPPARHARAHVHWGAMATALGPIADFWEERGDLLAQAKGWYERTIPLTVMCAWFGRLAALTIHPVLHDRASWPEYGITASPLRVALQQEEDSPRPALALIGTTLEDFLETIQHDI